MEGQDLQEFPASAAWDSPDGFAEINIDKTHQLATTVFYCSLGSACSLSYFCRESRSKALRFGAPYVIDPDNKHGKIVWFQPTKIIILYPYEPIRFTNTVGATSV